MVELQRNHNVLAMLADPPDRASRSMTRWESRRRQPPGKNDGLRVAHLLEKRFVLKNLLKELWGEPIGQQSTTLVSLSGLKSIQQSKMMDGGGGKHRTPQTTLPQSRYGTAMCQARVSDENGIDGLQEDCVVEQGQKVLDGECSRMYSTIDQQLCIVHLQKKAHWPVVFPDTRQRCKLNKCLTCGAGGEDKRPLRRGLQEIRQVDLQICHCENDFLMIPLPGDQVSQKTIFFDESEGTYRAIYAGELAAQQPIVQVPEAGAVVICKCVRITQRFAGVEVEAVVTLPGTPEHAVRLIKPLKGTIRLQDIYAIEELETPIIQNCFRPGDVIRAQIIGRGDASAGLLLSTGVNLHMGVVYAKSVETGDDLQIVAWNEMMNPRTGQRERRKCAKPY